jgi:hypothetical protein
MKDGRKNNSRPKEKDKKVPLTIYVRESEIKKMGGLDKSRRALKHFWNDQIFD